MPVTFQTPGHAMRLGVINLGHVINLTMAAEAADSAVDVGGVIVKNVVRRPMELHPLHGFATLPACPNRLQLRIILLHLAMAIHAGLRGGQVGMGCYLDKAVAIPAIHSQL